MRMPENERRGSDAMKTIHSVLRDVAGQPAGEGSSGPVTPTRPAVDVSAALDRVGGDNGLLRELADLLLEDYPRQLAIIEEALANRDWETVERESHGLKGAVANFSAAEAEGAARTLEYAARERRNAEIHVLFDRLKEQLSRVREELTRLETQ